MIDEQQSADAPPALILRNVEAMERAVSERFNLIERLHALIIKSLNPQRHFSLVYGKPRLNGNAAKFMYSRFGGKFEYLRDKNGIPLCIRHAGEIDGEPYYAYETFGRYTPPVGLGDTVEASGWFSSRDDFFWKSGDEVKALGEIDESNVRQASQTECFKKCIFAGLGIEQWDKEQLEALGINCSSIKGYGGKAAGSKGGQKVETPEETDRRGEIEGFCHQMYQGGAKCVATGKPYVSPTDVLTKLTCNDKFPGWRSFKAISAKSVNMTYKEVKEAFDAWEATAKSA